MSRSCNKMQPFALCFSACKKYLPYILPLLCFFFFSVYLVWQSGKAGSES